MHLNFIYTERIDNQLVFLCPWKHLSAIFKLLNSKKKPIFIPKITLNRLVLLLLLFMMLLIFSPFLLVPPR